MVRDLKFDSWIMLKGDPSVKDRNLKVDFFQHL
jgi:hypothetical protein